MVKFATRDVGFTRIANLPQIPYLPTMGDKSVETLSNKIEFLSILVTFSPFPLKQC